MLERDLLPDFSAEVLAELGKLHIAADMGDELNGPAQGLETICFVWLTFHNFKCT
jgi:hypothetical protein